MIRLILHITFLFCVVNVYGQQENLYTQFAFNKIAFNPGVAGENNYTTITGVNRSQWSGLIGAPKSQFVNVNLKPISKKYGFGISANHLSIGIQDRVQFSGQFAYKLKMKKASFNIGLETSFRRYTTDFTNPALIAIDGFENDPSIDQVKYTSNVINLGVGLYYKSDKLYAGLSIPRLVRGDLDFETTNAISRESRHVYAMVGASLELSDVWSYQPQLFFKIAENSPFNLDFLSMFSYQDKIHLGGNFRSGGSQKSFIESFNVILGFQFTDSIFAGMSYDFNLTDLSEYENGSFELLLKYNFKKNNLPSRIGNPRYFGK